MKQSLCNTHVHETNIGDQVRYKIYFARLYCIHIHRFTPLNIQQINSENALTIQQCFSFSPE